MVVSYKNSITRVSSLQGAFCTGTSVFCGLKQTSPCLLERLSRLSFITFRQANFKAFNGGYFGLLSHSLWGLFGLTNSLYKRLGTH